MKVETYDQARRASGGGERIVRAAESRQVNLYPVVGSKCEPGACGQAHGVVSLHARLPASLHHSLLGSPQFIVKVFGSRPASRRAGAPVPPPRACQKLTARPRDKRERSSPGKQAGRALRREGC